MESRATDREQFPGADVVRLGSPRWLTEPKHARTMQRLVEAVKTVISRYQGLDFEQIRASFDEEDPRVKVGNQHAYILYGKGLFVQDGELKMDSKGIVHRPCIRRNRRFATVELP